MKNDAIPMRIVRILEPSLCLSCRFGVAAVVEMQDGTRKQMLHCKLRDCDQCETEQLVEIPRSFTVG